ncbi:kinase-like protein [Mycena alexandri]|uniref:Kinase-like protein n=1 Tax=Mycena alexandri TaxID=1745969 RepID=A0AAD6T060_9AGAR|nr:kinase-like protein [Mycena alexandri]
MPSPFQVDHCFADAHMRGAWLPATCASTESQVVRNCTVHRPDGNSDLLATLVAASGMHKRIQIITSLLDKPSRSRSSPTRSPLSPISAPNEVKPHKKSIRQIALERKQSLTYPGALRTTATHPSIRRRTVIMAEDTAGIQIPKSFSWVQGEVIGRGAHGQVYLALNANTGTLLAVKQIRFGQDADELPGRPSPRTLRQELANMTTLSHPNLVEYLGHEESGQLFSVFIEYIPGGSIHANVRKYGTFDGDLVKSLVSQTLDGLIYLHARGIVHGALKSTNILLEHTGTCKIEGLGCSETEIRDDSRAVPRAIFWTAPEIIRTQYKSYNRMADIWSLGCIALEMLTGKRPWFNTEAVAVMYKLYQQTLRPHPPPDVELNPLAEDFVEKCLALNPEDRMSAVQLKQHPFLLLST